jgi:Ca2+-binding EF-hand superfamily protein
MSVGNIPLRKILEDEKKLENIARFAFSQVDKDNSGSITKAELAEIMNSIADDFGIEEPTNKEVDEVFRKLDKDESGLISFDEFKTLILRILELCED